MSSARFSLASSRYLRGSRRSRGSRSLVALVVDGLPADEVDDTLKSSSAPMGIWTAAAGILSLLRIWPMTRHGWHPLGPSCDETDTGDRVSSHLPVDGDGLRLDTRDGTKNEDGTVKDTQRTFYSMVSRRDGCVDDVDVEVLLLCHEVLARYVGSIAADTRLFGGRCSLPAAVGGGTLNGDTLLTLELHVVHLGTDGVLPRTSWISLIRPVRRARALSMSSYAVDVCRDTDVRCRMRRPRSASESSAMGLCAPSCAVWAAASCAGGALYRCCCGCCAPARRDAEVAEGAWRACE